MHVFNVAFEDRFLVLFHLFMLCLIVLDVQAIFFFYMILCVKVGLEVAQTVATLQS